MTRSLSDDPPDDPAERTESDAVADPAAVTGGAAADDPGRIKVGVGELAVTTDDAVLTTSGLGSCVAVALVDERAGARGLLHAMLPAGEGRTTATSRPAKYVDTGVDSLIASLDDAGADPRRLKARVAGGAEMLDLTDAVGPRNVERVGEVLDAAGVPIVASDVGDAVGRTVRFRSDGRLVVRAADGFERAI
ncbi:chemotaxis protein CheD [Halorubrum ezzemoulense]|uniref:Probable chemoreceptor glutamine deamidase CheD n=4 Tax=Halorubrum ezzemoulense TaxID=337243 RepID=A0A256JWY5_HALEZ|nr:MULTISPECIES: chemotaxis protein CheD [Halorubrum]MDB2238361.1 chemotaxis protein CheD [Halorubrum ezzemoulense]MDB2244080.1 chemotaxis protein CheD [Halorubrum ezzemoulense]MDB2247830.1 chemotaxis protein CheD [Halorubrum ezzemoulense]MDB2260526.1 chemotaxis protein CheD [Halorubrum ezzemoulense]MDB2267081.1 chemotaxis protein CheD [Halorubrum ezzemoulense]